MTKKQQPVDAAKQPSTEAKYHTPTGYQKSAIEIPMLEGSTDAEFAAAVSKKLTRPETSAAAVIEQWQPSTHDVNALAAELALQVQAVNGGDLQRAEGMLISQAHALENIFTNLARRAVNQQYLGHWETYMRMAMKAQNQCRMTLETLAAIKNPPVVYARQANINNGGQQQVNNGLTRAGVAADGKLTHCAEVKVTHLGEDGGLLAVDVDPGASSGDTSDGPKGRRSASDRAAAGLFAQHRAAVLA